MAKFNNQILPSLFDRLTDNEPRKSKEILEDQLISLTKYRQSILRDLLYLLNTYNLQANSFDLDLPENVANSTLNFGIPPYSGTNVSDMQWQEFENQIKQAILRFEPRIDKTTLHVTLIRLQELSLLNNQMVIEIQGNLLLNPYPQEFLLRTCMDIETGMFNLLESQTHNEF
jgi:type VI secretion system protein ImpF